MKTLGAIFLFIAGIFLSGNSVFGQEKEFLRQKIAEAEKIYVYNYAETMRIVEELYKMAERSDKVENFYAACYYIESQLNERHARYDSSLIAKLNRHLIALKKDHPEDISAIAFTQYSLALNYLIENQYIESFFAALDALNHFRTLNDTLHISKSLNILGRISSQILSLHLAQDYYQEALSYLNEEDVSYYLIKANIFLVSSFMKNHPQALVDSLTSLIAPIQRLGHPTNLFSIYSNLAVIQSIMEQRDLSLDYLHRIQETIHLSDNKYHYYNLYFNLAFYYRSQNQLDSALSYYNQAYEMAQIVHNNRLISNCLNAIALVYDQMGATDAAYQYFKEFIEIDQTLNNNARILESSQQYIYSILDYMEKEEEMHTQQLVLRNTIILTVIILAIAALLVVVLLLVIIKQRKNKQTLLKESLDLKMREITSSSLLLSSKNNVLSQIQEIVREMRPGGKDKSKISSINSLIKSNISTEQNWETFVMHFEQVHPGFFEKLKKYAPELTPTNLRFCAYFRLKLSPKEIATLLNITPNAVKTARFRLKKKLGLSESESLDDFIANI